MLRRPGAVPVDSVYYGGARHNTSLIATAQRKEELRSCFRTSPSGSISPGSPRFTAMDPRLKICLLVIAYIVLLFAAGNFAVPLALAVVYIGLVHGLFQNPL